jgi:SAM-dependent methyltransferase
MTGWELRCPQCGSGLGLLPSAVSTQPVLDCPGCAAAYRAVDGVWRLLAPGREADFARFLADYTTVRLAEGRGADDAASYRRLPEPTPGHPLEWQWSIRSTTWVHVRDRVLPRLGPALRVVDLGAGVGWLSHRLAELGHEPVAVDLSVDGRDGLGAARHYDPTWPRVQAEFDRLPFADAQADLVVFNASLHYSTDYAVTIAEACRVLRPGGRVLVVESPMYRREESGRRMVAERHAHFAERFGTRSDSVPSIEYLTAARLDELGEQLGLRWTRSTPWYGWRWWARPWVARLQRRREPSRFHVLVAERR